MGVEGLAFDANILCFIRLKEEKCSVGAYFSKGFCKYCKEVSWYGAPENIFVMHCVNLL